MLHPSVSRFMAELDAARLVRYDSNADQLFVWFGGHGVHVYDATGTEVDYWSCGDFAQNDASADDVAESMARRILGIDEILEQAEEAGYDLGKAAGSCVVDGNTPQESARRLLQGIEDGDPEVLDQLPGAPLSGEWAGALMPRDVLAWYELDEEHDAADDVLRAFEDGFGRGVVDEVVHSARAIVA
jgi:hypothetical protein